MLLQSQADPTSQSHAFDSDRLFVSKHAPFLKVNPNSDLSFDKKSTVYCSLVALVKAEYPFDNALQDKTARFLKRLEPTSRDTSDYAAKLMTDLVPSSDGSPSGFIDSIVILLSSPHSAVVGATMMFVYKTTAGSSLTIRCHLVESDLVSKVLASVQPHTLPICGNDEIFDKLITIIIYCLELAYPHYNRNLGIKTAVNQSDHREMIFQKVVLPSSQFISFLITHRHILNEDLFISFVGLLVTHLRICPYHRPTLEFVLTSPIAMAFSSCLSFDEKGYYTETSLSSINYSLRKWTEEGPEVAQSGKRMMQALFSEDIEDTLEQMLMNNKGGYYAISDLFEQTACFGPCRHILTFVHVGVLVVRRFQHNQMSLDHSPMEHGWIGLPSFCPTDSISCFSELDLFFTELDEDVVGLGCLESKLCPQPRIKRTRVKSPSIIVVNEEPFLSFDEYTELSFEVKSVIYSSLVALVKAEYPFHESLQDRAVSFLKNIEKVSRNKEEVDKLVTELVPSSDGSHSSFVESILTLLSSPHSTFVVAALSFLYLTLFYSSTKIRCCLVASDLISNVLATVQPHTLPIAGNETIFDNLSWIIFYCLELATPHFIRNLGVTAAVEKANRREMIFQNVVLPSSDFVTFLIKNLYILNEDLLVTFMILLDKLLEISPFHCPTLEFVLASPIAMAFSICLLFIEDDQTLWYLLTNTKPLLRKWKKEDPEMVQSAKRMIQALFSEGFENTLEQMTMSDEDGDDGFSVVDVCQSVTQLLGSNEKIPEWLHFK
ncbi:hypothetical protein BLNAU_3478 [Blattamonas nauphoetae]|uniref:Dymeclin n=1 Tax=Blattamonas nauphoetae TaxID=2049346 RepID=A0ABQ9YD85_9EUKA|nr:hypothetical protein BLNAU_3478 [Blattamonas nauphoetae]